MENGQSVQKPPVQKPPVRVANLLETLVEIVIRKLSAEQQQDKADSSKGEQKDS
jgi:hypothetical protein